MSQVEMIELSIERAKDMVARKDMALKLTSNREFKKLVLEGYLKEEAVRLTHLLADPAMVDQRPNLVDSLGAIAEFRQYMSHIVKMGEMAERELVDVEAELDAARTDEMEG